MIAAIVLAAGESRRMGENKLLLPLGDGCVLDRVLKTLTQCSFGQILLITGRDSELIAKVARKYACKIIYNENYAGGQTTSIKAGLEALGRDVSGAMFVMGDQPLITYRGIVKLMDAFDPDGESIVASFDLRDHKLKSPVLFHHTYFDELKSLQGDVGGRRVMKSHPDAVKKVEIEPSRFFLDVDTKQAYEKVLEEMEITAYE